MNLNDKNLLVKAMLVIAFSAATTAALSNEKWKVVFKNFIAGICGGGVIYIVSETAKLNETWIIVLCSLMSAFVSSLWPIIGSVAKKYIKKKSDDILPNH